MEYKKEASGTDHIQDLCIQVPSNKEQNEVDFEEKTTEALMENNITDQSNHQFEGLQHKGNNAAGSAEIVTLSKKWKTFKERLRRIEFHGTRVPAVLKYHFSKFYGT